MKIHRLDFHDMTLTYLGDTHKSLANLYQNIMNSSKNGANVTLLTDVSDEMYRKIQDLLVKVTVLAPEDEPDFVTNVELIASLIANANTLGDDFNRTNFGGLCRAWYQIAITHQEESRDHQRKIKQLELEIIDLKRKLEQGS